MGCGVSFGPQSIGSRLNASKRWKNKLSRSAAKKLYEKEGSIPLNCGSDLLELRVCLEDPILVASLGMFAKERKCLSLLMFWADTLEFKLIPQQCLDLSLSKALHIYHKYIKADAVVPLRFVNISSDMADDIYLKLMKVKEANSLSFNNGSKEESTPPFNNHLYDVLLKQCFLQIYAGIYLNFKGSPIYKRTIREMKMTYNHVGPDDFEYYEELGHGTFGFVVHCK